MNTAKFLSALPQFLILLPAAASCYLSANKHMKYSPKRTTFLCLIVLLPYCAVCALLLTLFHIDIKIIFIPSLVIFFFLYRLTVNLSMSCSLAIYVGVCAIETFPVQFSYAFDAALNPASGAADFSTEAALVRFGLSLILLAAFVYPATHQFQWVVDNINFPRIWYEATALSSIFLIFNAAAIPLSYSTLHTGRMYRIFIAFEAVSLMVLVAFYILFYQGATFIVKHARLEERTRLLEMQSHQYHALKNHMSQTARLRHDFRHSVHLLSSLAEKNDFDSIKTHLAEYESSLTENIPVQYCANAALNALFGYYHEMAVLAQISTDWHIELPEPLIFSELDMAALFGNILENAIEGCRSVPKDFRYFCLTSEIRNGNSLYVVSTNSFDGKTKKGREGYLSTKHSGTGTGIASICAVSEKYGGSANISNSSREFFVDVVMKISNF